MKLYFFLFFSISNLVGIAQINQTDDKGRKQGVWEKKYPNSNSLQYQGQFKDNKPVGIFTYYYPEGQVKAVIEHLKDGHKSKATFYFENKMMMSDGFYLDQKKDSTWVNYNPEGLVLSIEDFKNDKLNGKKVIYYLEGQLETEKLNPLSISTYKNDTLNGEYKEFFTSGKLKLIGSYVAGKMEGRWLEYHPNGNILKISKFKNDRLHGWTITYTKDGKENGKVMYQFGEKLLDKDLENYLKLCEKKGIDPNQ